MVTKTIVHFEIPAQDVEKLSKFYSDLFGWKFEKRPMGEMDYWMITTGPRAKSVYGGMYKKQMDVEMPRNYIAVDKIDKSIEAFTQGGGKQILEKMEVPGIGWTFIGIDPEGNAIGLFEGARAPPKPKKKTAKKR